MCNLTINSVSDNNLHTVTTVTGTAIGCSKVLVNITCGTGGSFGGTSGQVIVNSNGNWTAAVKRETKCLCNTPINIKVECVDGNATCEALWNGIIPCDNLNTGQSCCPMFDISTSFGPCINGNRQVTITYTIYPPTNQSCYSDASYNWNIEFPNTSQLPIHYAYPPSNIVQGSVVLTLPIGANQTVEFNKLNTNGLSCDNIIKSFSVPNCDCCPNAIADITYDISESCNKDGKTKNVKIEALITPTPQPNCPANVQAEMWIDNSLVATGTGSAPFTLSHQNDFECLIHNVTIKYPGSDCPDSGGTFCVSVCEKPSCHIKRINFEIAWVTSLISGLLYSFNPTYTNLLYTAIIALILAVIFYFIWKPCRKICKKCPLYLAIWQIALATFCGFLLLSKSSLQSSYSFLSYYVGSTLAIVIIALVIILILLLIYYLYKFWVSKCCPTECEKWTYIYESVVNICLISTGIVAAVIAMLYGASALLQFWLPYYTIIQAVLIYYVWIKKIQKCN